MTRKDIQKILKKEYDIKREFQGIELDENTLVEVLSSYLFPLLCEPNT